MYQENYWFIFSDNTFKKYCIKKTKNLNEKKLKIWDIKMTLVSDYSLKSLSTKLWHTPSHSHTHPPTHTHTHTHMAQARFVLVIVPRSLNNVKGDLSFLLRGFGNATRSSEWGQTRLSAASLWHSVLEPCVTFDVRQVSNLAELEMSKWRMVNVPSTITSCKMCISCSALR